MSNDLAQQFSDGDDDYHNDSDVIVATIAAQRWLKVDSMVWK